MITPEQSAAFYAARGIAAGEQDDCDGVKHYRSTTVIGRCDCDRDDRDLEDDERIPCACRDHFLYGVDSDCPACDGSGFVDTPNEWCDRCGLHGTCPWCDPDRYRDERDDR